MQGMLPKIEKSTSMTEGLEDVPVNIRFTRFEFFFLSASLLIG
jgi:hypothetical protein